MLRCRSWNSLELISGSQKWGAQKIPGYTFWEIGRGQLQEPQGKPPSPKSRQSLKPEACPHPGDAEKAAGICRSLSPSLVTRWPDLWPVLSRWVAGSWGLGREEGAGQASEFQLSIERGSWSPRTGKTERQTCACLCPRVLRSVPPGSGHGHVCVHARHPPTPISVCEDRNRERLTLCGPSWGSTGLCIGGVWERGPGGPGEAWGTGGSGPALPGLLLAKGEFCCLFILVLSSTC